jgi:hypothetical protein
MNDQKIVKIIRQKVVQNAGCLVGWSFHLRVANPWPTKLLILSRSKLIAQRLSIKVQVKKIHFNIYLTIRNNQTRKGLSALIIQKLKVTQWMMKINWDIFHDYQSIYSPISTVCLGLPVCLDLLVCRHKQR